MKVFQHNSLDYLSAQLFLSPGPAQHVLDVYMLLHICWCIFVYFSSLHHKDVCVLQRLISL